MKTSLKITAFLMIAFLLTNCKEKVNVVEKNNAQVLLENLKKVNSKGILFGHQDDLAYGIDWKYNKNKGLDSDVKRATGQFPTVFGWDVGHIGDSLNIDGIPFKTMKELIVKADSMGGINTISWHIKLNDSITSWYKKSDIVKTVIPGGKKHQKLIEKLDHFSDFIMSLKRKDGSIVPVIFRPWHEMSGNWFWWGQEFCNTKDFKKLFTFTIDYLKNKKGLDNLVITYAPDRQFHSEEEYLKWYPGDEYIDIIAFDNYYDFKKGGEGIDAIIKKIEILIAVADKKEKIAAFTETGFDKLEHEKWYTQELYKVLDNKDFIQKLSYIQVWRNHDTTHFYVPYQSHPSFKDFKEFTTKKEILLLDDFLKEITE
jgi:mannan endo-1,4-beta-mannosidase